MNQHLKLITPELLQNQPQAKRGKERATLSCAMIVKNEGATLEETIKSFKEVINELVILVDDSSTDNTYEIAEKYADVCEWYKWEEDFASARNLVMSKCTKDWIILFDGHEILHPRSKLILDDLMWRVAPGGDVPDTEVFSGTVYMNPANLEDIDNVIPETFFLQPRLIKNNGRHLYTGRVHNWLITDDPAVVVKRPVNELVILHMRTPENNQARLAQRRDMNVRLLQKDIEDNPSMPRPYFYLAQTYYEANDLKNAIRWYKKYLRIATWREEMAHANLMMATIYAKQKQFGKARDCAMEGMRLNWERPEFCLILGDMAFEAKRWYEAWHWFNAAKEMKAPQNGMFLNGASYTYLPYMKCAAAHSHLSKWFEAIKDAERAIELGCPEETFRGKVALWKKLLKVDPRKENLILYDETNRFTFLQDIKQKLGEFYNIGVGNEYDVGYGAWGRIIFFEWCDKLIVQASGYPKPEGQKWIVRLHGYELYRPNSIMQVDWEKVDYLVFVADHVRRKFEEMYGELLSYKLKGKVRIIPNGLDLTKWSFAKREHSTKKNIGIVGVLSPKKGPDRLAMVARHFAEHHPEYKFLLRFDVPPEQGMLLHSLKHDLRDVDNCEFVKHVASMNSWMEDLKFLISTSNIESFSFVIAEAMAKGVKPLIYDWYGADELWPKELIWKDMEGLEKVLAGEYVSEKYRQWVSERYNLKKTVAEIRKLMK